MSCASGTVRILVFGVNLLFAIIGIAFLITGIVYKVHITDVTEKLDQYDFNQDAIKNSPIAFIVLGSVILIISFFGCCGAWWRNSCMLTTYSVFVFVIFFIQLAVAITILVLVRKGNMNEAIHTSVESLFDKYNDQQKPSKESVDSIQQNFECCGVDSPDYWKKRIVAMPESCYADNKRINKKFEQGCATKLTDFLIKSQHTIGYVLLGLALITLLGGIFGCFLSSTIRNEDRRGAY